MCITFFSKSENAEDIELCCCLNTPYIFMCQGYGGVLLFKHSYILYVKDIGVYCCLNPCIFLCVKDIGVCCCLNIPISLCVNDIWGVLLFEYPYLFMCQ